MKSSSSVRVELVCTPLWKPVRKLKLPSSPNCIPSAVIPEPPREESEPPWEMWKKTGRSGMLLTLLKAETTSPTKIQPYS
jgi:hypothetical protein